MRLLYVAMCESVHTSRWISQIADQGWDVHLFPSNERGGVHPGLRNVTVHQTFYGNPFKLPAGVRNRGLPVFSDQLAKGGRLLVHQLWPMLEAARLRSVVRSIKPDILHSMEFQAGGYLTLAAKQGYSGKFPAWIATNWGSDLYLFGRLTAHQDKIRAVLKACDYYSCECQRDVLLAKEMGLAGQVLPVLPNSGGFDLAHCQKLRTPGRTSERKLILLKGYQSFAGRALVGLRAITLCAQELQGYRVGVYVANQDVAIAAELAAKQSGIPIEIIPPCSHDEMLRLYGKARIYVGLSISDAISTSLLEAMVMGAFPIQSCTACADEWIQDGQSGLIVPPEDPEIVAAALRRALQDDRLVDKAAEVNDKAARERLDQTLIRPQVVQMYNSIISASLHRV